MPSDEEFRELKDQVASLSSALATARRRIDDLEDGMADHLGLDWGESLVDVNSPHPNISANTIESGGGIIRQDANGMQVEGNSATAGIYFVERLTGDPDALTAKGVIYGYGDETAQEAGIELRAYTTSAVTSAATLSIGTDNYWQLAGTGGGGFYVYSGTGGVSPAGYVSLSATASMLLLGVFPSDPTNTSIADGMVWYRSDTDRVRVRANGATKNLAFENTIVAGDGSELTIASGAITITTGYHTVDTEADAASDDLDTISGGVTGQILTVRAIDAARTVVAKDGTGNLKLAGDCTLDNAEDTLTLTYTGTNWLELSRSDNGA